MLHTLGRRTRTEAGIGAPFAGPVVVANDVDPIDAWRHRMTGRRPDGPVRRHLLIGEPMARRLAAGCGR